MLHGIQAKTVPARTWCEPQRTIAGLRGEASRAGHKMVHSRACLGCMGGLGIHGVRYFFFGNREEHMKKKTLMGAASALAVVVGGYVGATAYTGHRVAAAYEAQLLQAQAQFPFIH